MVAATRVDALIELVHHYYPSGVSGKDPRYGETEQARLLRSLLRAAGCDAGEGPPATTDLLSAPADAIALGAPVGALQAWPALIQALRATLPDCDVSESTLPWPAPCYRCAVELPGSEQGHDVVVCLVSVLAPVYAVFVWQGSPSDVRPSLEPLPAALHDRVEQIEALVASTLGFVRLPDDVLHTVIPDVVPEHSHCALGEATLLDCLFTPHRPRVWPSPGWIVPWPPEGADEPREPDAYEASEALPATAGAASSAEAAHVDALIELVHYYYPAGIGADDPRYRQTEQARRLRRLLRATARDMGDRTDEELPPVPADALALGAPVRALRAWPAFLNALRAALPGYAVSNVTVPRIEPCYKCQVARAGTSWQRDGKYDALVCLVSLLAPVYAVYSEHHAESGSRAAWAPVADDFRVCEDAVDAMVASVFGFTRVPGNALLTPIPDLVPDSADVALGEATLLDCLFTPSHP